jgi:hypothetical protein
MEALRTLAVLLPLGLSSGINLYATVLVIGLSVRLGWVTNPPAGLGVLAAWPIIIVAAIFYLLEFFADKIPFVDNLWDVVHTFIRPLGAALLAWAALSHTADPAIVVLGALAAGSVALVAHGSKAGTRVAVNVVSPLENATNTGLSLGEDVLAAGLTLLALKTPLLAGLLAAALLVFLILVVPQVLRWAWFTVRALLAWAGGLGHRKRSAADALPADHAAVLGITAPELAAQCRAQNVKGAGGRSGYLVVANGSLAYTYSTRAGPQAWRTALPQVREVRLMRRALIDVLSVRYVDSGPRERTARFVFLKDRSLLAQQFALRLAALRSSTAPAQVLPAGSH